MVQARVLTIVLIVLVALGLLLEIIAVATTGWVKHGLGNYGLFKYCPRGFGCGDYSQADFTKATAAFCIIGIIIAAVCLILIILRMVMEKMASNSIVRLCVLIFAWVAFVCYFLAIVIFGAKVKNNLDYSYALACVACILQLVAAILATLMHLRVGPAEAE